MLITLDIRPLLRQVLRDYHAVDRPFAEKVIEAYFWGDIRGAQDGTRLMLDTPLRTALRVLLNASERPPTDAKSLSPIQQALLLLESIKPQQSRGRP